MPPGYSVVIQKLTCHTEELSNNADWGYHKGSEFDTSL
jgi:hypothetical protein